MGLAAFESARRAMHELLRNVAKPVELLRFTHAELAWAILEAMQRRRGEIVQRRRCRGHRTVAGGALIERTVVAVQLDSVTLLEAVVQVLEEVIEGRRRLVGKLGEDERIRLVAHLSEPLQRGVGHSTLAS